MKLTHLTYEQARNVLQEGDILLFRGKMFWWGLPTASFFIIKATGGIHTHVGMATKWNNHWECVEFREWKGGRVVSLESQIKESSGRIDVFRVKSPGFKWETQIKDDRLFVKKKILAYNGKKATQFLRNLTGLPYGWPRIWAIAKYYMFGLRLFVRPKIDDDIPGNNVYVCSTAVTEAISRNYLDPVPWRPDNLVSPAHLASSALLQYMFTLGEGND